MFVIKTPNGMVCDVDYEFMICVTSNDLKYVKRFKTAKAAQSFISKWGGTGVGLVAEDCVIEPIVDVVTIPIETFLAETKLSVRVRNGIKHIGHMRYEPNTACNINTVGDLISYLPILKNQHNFGKTSYRELVVAIEKLKGGKL